MSLPTIQIYTDGSCSPNPGPGGWAAVMLFDKGDKIVELQGAEEQSTNNRMELLASLKALQSLEEVCKVEVVTDSRYLQRGITEWLEHWRHNGWRTSEGVFVKNRDLWEQFAGQLEYHQVRFTWVKGHGKDTWNKRADELAVAARKSRNPVQPPVGPDTVHIYPGVTWKNSSGSGSWAIILNYRHHYKVLGGWAENTTANRLYLVAVLEGIRAMKRVLPINIYTRSGYLRDGLETWVEGWRKRGWRTREGADISNGKQWRELANLKEVFEIHVAAVSSEEPPCHLLAAKEIAREFEQLQSEVLTDKRE
ncbi:ribonuclease HI [Desulfopila inferna]|nr:ribonuclease HI [Desulfopila inferna]MBM9605829.1 ribonuclease HI [Desulfopila inferna]